METSGMDETQLRTELEKYKVNHTIRLTEGLSTPGQTFPNEAVSLAALRSIDVAGKRVLDIGCTFFNEKGARDTLGSLGFTVERIDHGTPPAQPNKVHRLKGAIKHLFSPKTPLAHMPITQSVNCLYQRLGGRIRHCATVLG